MLLRATLLAAVSVCLLSAQSNQASISGVVTDAQGAAVPNAKVVATSTATDIASTTVTNDTGFYSIPALQIGSYIVTVEREGFRGFQRRDVTLTTGQVLELRIRLEVGAVSETVTVTGETPLVETRNSDVTQLIESKSIENLPLGNRRALNVIALSPSAVFVAYGNNPGNATPMFSLAGGRTQSQMFWIDGGAGQNLRLGAAQINLDPPVETVGEIKILSNNNSAEYGGSAGGIIVANTKSGTNQFRGSLYEYLRNDALDAPGYFATIRDGAKVKTPLRYNVFGGVIGGPVIRDKTFFFFAYEGQRLRTGGSRYFHHADRRTASRRFFADVQRATGGDPDLRPGHQPHRERRRNPRSIPGNRIPASQLDPVGLRLMQFFPLPNRAPDNVTGANNVRGNYVTSSNANFYMVKIDHNLGSKDRITGRYIHNTGANRNTSVFPDPGADPRNSADNKQRYVYGSWTRTVSPTVVNDLRFTYIYRLFHNLSNGLGGGYPTKIGLKGVPDTAFPRFAPAGFSPLGTNPRSASNTPSSSSRSWTICRRFGASMP